MSARRWCVLVLALAACGDNVDEAGPDAAGTACSYTPPEAPLHGLLRDPNELPLPQDCVRGGLVDLPGRWFVRDPAELFEFEYPKFEGDCTTGFRRANFKDEHHDDNNNYAFDTWSDGTRVFYREDQVFNFQGGTYEYANAFAACMMPDGSLSAVHGIADSDRGLRTYPMPNGKRFAPKDAGAQGLTLVGAIDPATAKSEYNLVIDGTYAYAVGPAGFDAVDIADPTAPKYIGHVDGAFNDVKFVRTNDSVIAYASPIDTQPTAIIDVTDPTAPAKIGQIMAYSHSVFVSPPPAPKLYLATYGTTVPVYDLANPRSPVRLGAVPISGTDAGIHDIHVVGSRIYADKTTDGMVAVDVSNGLTLPTELGRIPTSYSHATWEGLINGRRIAIHGDEGMGPEGGAFMRVIDADAASATFMQVIGTYRTRAEVGIHNMIIVGTRAYVAYYHDGIRIVELADPTHPVEIAHYNTWDPATAEGEAFEAAIGLAIVGDLIYVADIRLGVIVLRLDPTL